jgi:tripartite-type tricarboxylate transporter receptor subunit TctC
MEQNRTRPEAPSHPSKDPKPLSASESLNRGKDAVGAAVMPDAIEYVRVGKLHPLAVTTATRFSVMPEIPTVSEFLPGYETSYWLGVGAPKSTPSEIIDKLNKEINAGLADAKLKERIAGLGGTVLPASPVEFGKLIADDTEKWAKVIKFAGIKAD